MKKLIWLVIASFIFVVACKKENEPISLKIYPQHHGAPIYGATAYIEYNTQTNAGSLSNYDLTRQAEASKDYIYVTPFGSGNFFIYCSGYDSTISQPVLGGIPFVIPKGHTGEFAVKVPVTE